MRAPPLPGHAALAWLDRRTLAVCTVEFGHIPETIERNAVQVILSDHHYWGGLRATQHLAHVGRIFDIGISMHSNSHSAWPTCNAATLHARLVC